MLTRDVGNPRDDGPLARLIEGFLVPGGLPGLTVRPYGPGGRTCDIDREVARLLRDAESRATQLLREQLPMLHRTIDLLLERETIDGADLATILGLPVPAIPELAGVGSSIMQALTNQPVRQLPAGDRGRSSGRERECDEGNSQSAGLSRGWWHRVVGDSGFPRA